MFNTLDEHLFLCQSLPKEQRRPPTGGLRQALKESLGEGFPRPRPLLWGQKRPLEPLKFGFPLVKLRVDVFCLAWCSNSLRIDRGTLPIGAPGV